MCVDEMKTIGAVEVTLGLLELSLGLILQQVPITFRKVLPALLCTAATTACVGLFLICGGRKPRYFCVRLNTVLHLPVAMLNTVVFGFLVQFVPHRQRELPTTILIGGIVIVLLVSLILGILLSLYLALVGWSVMIELTSQTQVPECSATTEPLCVEMSQDSISDQTKSALNQNFVPDQTEAGQIQDLASPGQTRSELNQKCDPDTKSSETTVQVDKD